MITHIKDGKGAITMSNPTYVYPDGPTERDLKELRQSYRNQSHPGLFINDNEYITYSALLEEMEDQRKQENVVEADAVIEEENDAESEEEISFATDTSDSNAGKSNQTEDEQITKATLYTLDALDDAHRLLDADNRKSDTEHGLARRFKQMKKQGGERRLVELPDGWEDGLDMLGLRYPNFSAVIAQIRTESQLAELSQPRVMQLPPLLLCGAPGIGKTAFSLDLAKLLNKGFFYYSMENAQHGFSLCGSDSHWGNTQTGLVFDALIDHDCINPLFLVDELDKASTDSRHDPIAPLYKLLEAKQAAQFRDESIPELSIDASYINWIFTANNLNCIPSPIRNRLQVIDVPPPTIEQGKGIVQNLFVESVDEIANTIRDQDTLLVLYAMALKEDALFYLAVLSVRQAKMKLRSAIAKALVAKNRAIQRSDLAEMLDLKQMVVEEGEAGAH